MLRQDSREEWIKVVNAFFNGNLLVDGEVAKENESFDRPLSSYTLSPLRPLTYDEVVVALDRGTKFCNDRYIINEVTVYRGSSANDGNRLYIGVSLFDNVANQIVPGLNMSLETVCQRFKVGTYKQ